MTSSSSAAFDHAPNVDAVLYFAREIFPRILDRIPDAMFQVIGPDPTPEICRLASPSIHILGFVPDVKPIFDRARVSVAPLRFGAGVKGKVNQSMSLGVPTVVTSIAAEGMYLTHGENAMIADRSADASPTRSFASGPRPNCGRKSRRTASRISSSISLSRPPPEPIDELLDMGRLVSFFRTMARIAPMNERAFEERKRQPEARGAARIQKGSPCRPSQIFRPMAPEPAALQIARPGSGLLLRRRDLPAPRRVGASPGQRLCARGEPRARLSPRIEGGAREIASFPAKFEAYFNDQFGFRKRLIHWLSFVKVAALAQLPLPRSSWGTADGSSTGTSISPTTVA